MTNDPHEPIRAILDSRDLQRFLGLTESDVFEAKGKLPYNLDSAAGRMELAKDVSSLANERGGFLVIGLAETPSTTEDAGVVSALELMEEKAFAASRMRGVLQQHVYPEISGLAVGWAEGVETPGFGIGYVFVPAQSDDQKYFLMTKLVDGDERLKEIVVGIARRFGAHSVPMTHAQLHGQLREGMNTVSQRLTSIEKKFDRVSQGSGALRASSKRIPWAALAQRIADIKKV